MDGLDKFTGGLGNDTFTANYDAQPTAAHELGALDSIDGGAGMDTLNITSDNGATAYTMANATISNIEKMTIAGSAAVTADVSGTNVTGLESITLTKSAAATVTAAATTDVTVSGATGLTTVTGGKSVTINQDTSKDLTSALDNAAGTADVANNYASIVVEKAKDVTITATNSKAVNIISAIDTDTGIFVGSNAANGATGAVSITATGAKTDGAAATLDAITVNGGTTVNVTQVATSDMTEAQKDTSAISHTLGAVTIVGGDTTTSVTVKQDEEVGAKNAQVAVTGVATESTVKFVDMKKDETVTVDSLIFTASKDLTAAQVAEAFAGLSKSDFQDNGGVVANGIYTGKLSANWTSGAANGDTVVFTEVTPTTGTAVITVTDTIAASNVTATKTVSGKTAQAEVTGVLGVINGAVTVNEGTSTASITDLTVDGYGAGATLGGGGGSLDALTTLTLKNSNAGTASVTTTATALTIVADDVDSAVTVSNTVKDLTLTTENVASGFALNTTAVENLTINAGANLTLTGSALITSTSAKTITVNGAATANIGDISTNTGLNSFNAASNTGGVTAQIATKDATLTGSISEYVFSAGKDTITLDETDIDVKVTAGAGDDKVTIAAGTSAAAKVIDGGDGMDTLSMTFATANLLDTTVTFDAKAINFEKLEISNAVTTNSTTDLAFLTYDYVIAHGTTAATHTIDNMVSNGTVELNSAAGTYAVNVKDAALVANTSDVLNIVANAVSTASTDLGQVTVAKVETINITATDTDMDDDNDTIFNEVADDAVETISLDLVAADATKVVVDGNANLTLNNTSNTKVGEIDGSAMTGALTVTAAGTTSTIIKGGSAGDTLVGSSSAAAGTVNKAVGATLTYTTAITGANEKTVADFAGDMAEGDVVTVGGLTLTLNADNDASDTVTITAANTAAAFANLLAGATAGNTPILTGNLDLTTTQTSFYTNALIAGYTTGAVINTDQVTFTATTEGDATDITKTDAGATTVTLTKTDAVAQKITVDVATAFANATLDKGDKISIDVDIDGTGGTAATTYAYTVTDTTETRDSAMAQLLLLIEADTTNINATNSTYVGTTLTIEDKIAGANGVTLSNFTVTDASATAASGDSLYGNAGNDKLTGGDLTKLYGGDGADTFFMNTPTNVNSYSTIMDLTAGDIIDLDSGNAGTVTFSSSAIVLASTAVFQDYANATAKSLKTDANDAAWFKYDDDKDGNFDTYIIQSGDSIENDFQNGTDKIIKIVGEVDLSTASYNMSQGTIEIA